jgi:protein arginine kinase activator
MARLLKCDCCGAPATVHLVQISNGTTYRINFCAACAREKGVVDESGSPTDMLLGSGLFRDKSVPGSIMHTSCCNCGLDGAALLENKVFGCARCYETFSNLLDSLMKRIQRSGAHCGKKPQTRTIFLQTAAVEWNRPPKSEDTGEMQLPRNVAELELLLSLAVSEERYEDAATIRARIDDVVAAQKKKCTRKKIDGVRVSSSS